MVLCRIKYVASIYTVIISVLLNLTMLKCTLNYCFVQMSTHSFVITHSITELEKEISALRQGLDFIEKEVTWHRSQGSTAPGDRFRLAMNEFTALAKDKFTNLESQFNIMKTQVSVPYPVCSVLS